MFGTVALEDPGLYLGVPAKERWLSQGELFRFQVDACLDLAGEEIHLEAQPKLVAEAFRYLLPEMKLTFP